VDRLRLRCLTFNLWVDHDPQARLDAALPEIAALAPDVLLLQEVRATPDLPNTAEQLARGLGLPGLAFARMTLAGNPHQQGVAIVSRHPLRDVAVTKLGGAEKALRYRLLSARIDLGGRTIGVHSTHLRWQPAARAIRRSQVRVLLRALDAYHCDAHVLGGDMNAGADTAELGLLRARLLDTFAHLHPDDPGLTWSARNPHTDLVRQHGILPDRRIDFLLCSPVALGGVAGVRASRVVLDAPVGDRWLSDHFGLLSELELDVPAPPQA
jgi:endonuclease/exonuclease/phosphatase family metal-dependent hydrolase